MTARLPTEMRADDLVIRLWAPSDAEPLSALIVDNLEHFRPWMAWAHDEPLSAGRRRRQLDRWHRYWESGQGALYAIEHRDRLVGGCALHRRIGPGGLDVGYWLAADATGFGIVTRTVRTLIDASFQLADVDHIEISHDSNNARSGAIAQRLGFVDVTPADAPSVTIWRLRQPPLPNSTA